MEKLRKILMDDALAEKFYDSKLGGGNKPWSHFKRMIFGTYYSVSKKHLQRYIDEYVFRFNTRFYTNFQRIDLYLRNIA